MNFNSILLNREGAVCVLTLNRPDTMNALSEELVSEMDQALELVAGDEEIRVLIITGHEKVFVAGGDIKAMQECDPFQARQYVAPIHNLYNKLERLPKPTIAAISGYTLGGGVELTLACDFRIAADNAKFGFPEVNLGIFPAAGGSQRLPRLIGPARAKELMFTADIIDAATALSIGLVSQVVLQEELMKYVQELAEKLAKKAPVALRMLKESIHAGSDIDLQTGLVLEVEKFCHLFSTRDQKEGMTAFVERRKPVFIGK